MRAIRDRLDAKARADAAALLAIRAGLEANDAKARREVAELYAATMRTLAGERR